MERRTNLGFLHGCVDGLNRLHGHAGVCHQRSAAQQNILSRLACECERHFRRLLRNGDYLSLDAVLALLPTVESQTAFREFNADGSDLLMQSAKVDPMPFQPAEAAHALP